MCGIAGIVYHERERPVSESLVRRMCAALRHRGPDDEGLYVHGAVGLGMRRLSIIDLSGGRQPIFNEDDSKVVVDRLLQEHVTGRQNRGGILWALLCFSTWHRLYVE